MLHRAADWFEHRTGFMGAARRFLHEPLPSSVGWRNTLGSAAGALLLIQMLSGFLLALYFVPHPEAAYASLKFVEEGIAGGSIVRALHYWGASFIVVALFFHMIRVFWSGAYRAPREMTWLFGVMLFGVVMLFAFTGQLLPWNQDGYWAAKVGVEIASSAPVAGPYIKKLLLGGGSIGALTLSRFYAVHVILLPGVLGVLVIGHLHLLRRHGPAVPESDAETVPFHPHQTFRDILVVSGVLLALAAVIWFNGGPVSDPADPADTSHVPRPEWYLLSHYEILRFTPGPLKILATFVLPNIFLMFLVALPWLDRSKGAGMRGRRLVLGAGSAIFATIIGLTLFGVVSEAESAERAPAQIATYDKVEAGRALFVKLDCQSCHRIEGEGQEVGPDLSGIGLRLKEDYMRKWLMNPQAFVPDTQMPAAKVNQSELGELTAYLQSLTHPSGG